MASSTNTIGTNVRGSEATTYKYEFAKTMKLAKIKINSPLSDYTNLAGEYIVLLNQLNDSKSDIRKSESAEVAALQRIPGNAQEAHKTYRVFVSRRHQWKVESFGAFRECIQELEEMKMKKTNSKDKEFNDQANDIIAKYQGLIKATVTGSDKGLDTILDSLNTYYQRTLSKNNASSKSGRNVSHTLSCGRSQYRKCFERCEQWLEAAKIDPNTTKEQNNRIREHEEHYRKSVAEKATFGRQTTAAPKAAQRTGRRPEAIAIEDGSESGDDNSDGYEEYEEWYSSFFNDAMHWHDRGFD